jgi:hypothetical protein
MTCTILWKYIWNVRARITDWIMVQSCVSSFPSSYFTSESFCWLFKYSEWRKSCTIVPKEWKEIVRILTFRNKAIPQWHVTNNELYKRQNCSTMQLAIPQWHVTNNELYKRQKCSTAQLAIPQWHVNNNELYMRQNRSTAQLAIPQWHVTNNEL